MPSSKIGRLARQFARRAFAALASLSLVMAPIPAAHAEETGGVIRDAEIEATLRAYADPIFTAAGLKPEEVRVYIVEDRSLNAFVSGGQNMFIHTGLIMAAQTPNQLKGVMAHETGHMAAGHLVRAREGQSQAMVPALISIGLGVLAMAGGAPDAGAALISGSQQFMIGQYMTFTQTQESSADQAGVTYMDATHQSPEGLLDFFQNFREQELFSRDRREPLFRSHPLSSERIQALRERVEKSAYRDAKDSDADMLRFKMMQAKLYGYLEGAGRVYARYPDSDKSQPARYARAFAAYRIPDMQRAAAETKELIGLDGKNPYYQELMGQILFESGHWADALPYDRKAVALSPDSVLLQTNLGRALAASSKKEDLDEAVKVLTRATALEPDNPYAWSEMATAYGALIYWEAAV